MKPKIAPPSSAAPSPAPAVSWEQTPLEWPRATGHADLLLAALAVREKRRRRCRATAVIGGATALVLAGLVWLSPGTFSTSPGPAASAGTALVVAPQHQTLPDGSVVELKPGAEIAVNFDATPSAARQVTLLRGEAHFQVAKNPLRPFVVTARGVQVRAVGTAFSVDLRTTAVETLVTEGRVAVAQSADDRASPAPAGAASASPLPQPNSTMVDAGNRVVVDLAQPPPSLPLPVLPVSAAELSEKLAWRIPRLEFTDTPLWEVASLLNRHSRHRISLANPQLGRVAISGVLRADNIEPLLQMLETNYRIRVTRRADGDIELH